MRPSPSSKLCESNIMRKEFSTIIVTSLFFGSDVYSIFNCLGLAGAVLQTPLSLIGSLIN